MSTTYGDFKSRNGKKARQRTQYRARSVSWDWCSVGAIFGLSGGIISVLLGSVLTALTWFTGTAGAGSYVRSVGAVLLVLTIPLFIFGAHCLDLREKRRKAARESRFA
jgi:hypothetical protein